jgi:hypothetical protein
LQGKGPGKVDGYVPGQVEEVDSVFKAVGLRPGSQERADQGKRGIGAEGAHAPNPRAKLFKKLGGYGGFDFAVYKDTAPSGLQLKFDVKPVRGLDFDVADADVGEVSNRSLRSQCLCNF